MFESALMKSFRTMRPIACLILALLFVTPLWARQEPAPVTKAIEDYLRIQTKGLPGQTSFTVGSLDPNNNLAPCAAFEVGLAPGTRLWGRTSVNVRCVQEGGWSVFVPVRVRVVGDYLVTGRALSQGQTVTDADIGRQHGDLADLPAGILTERHQAIGHTAAQAVPAGRPLRGDMLRQALVIQQGQSVKVVSKGTGFQVANEGRALNNAVGGQVVQVRLGNGQVVSGIARPGGYVEVGF